MTGSAAQRGWLPAAVPDAAVVGLAVVAVGVWVAMHFGVRRPGSRRGRAAGFAVRSLVGCGAIGLVLTAAARWLVFETTWSLWTVSLVGGVAVEVAAGLYALERRIVPRSVGLALVALRLAAVVLVLWMLAQPVFSREESRTLRRVVAVLVDDSASMHLTDRQATASEKLRLVPVFRPGESERPFRLDESTRGLEAVRRKLAALADWLGLLEDVSHGMRLRQLESRRKSIAALFEETGRAVARHLGELDKVSASRIPLDRAARAALRAATAKLLGDVREALAAAGAVVTPGKPERMAGRFPQLLGQTRRAGAALGEALARSSGLAARADEAFFASLPRVRRRDIDRTVLRPRRAVARAVLLGVRGGKSGVMAALGRKYAVKFYTFAARPAETEVEAWRRAVDAAPARTTEPAATAPDAQATDIAAALEKVMADVPPDRLAGVLLLTDGRHNARADTGAVARRLGAQRAPVCSVVIGSAQPPPDAAITGVVSPHAVYVNDQLVIEARLKFDGLRGKDALVQLTCGGEVIDEHPVRVLGDRFRTVVDLTDVPKEKGIRTYEVRVRPFEGETFRTNNGRAVNVSVTDDRTRLLLIEDRPRWEYRYLRALFATRDKSVRLQYVLVHPDRIEKVPPRPVVPASASRQSGDCEATALPENETEWLRFDVVVLGDVSPEVLGKKELGILRKFVAERGGTLVVIAGPQYMPHAFADTPLRDLLPVNFDPAEGPVLESPEESFRLVLTEAGRNHIVTRQSDVAEDNLRVWASRPELYWRHPIRDTKPGATVLAFAMPRNTPAFFREEALAPGRAAEPVLRRRRRFQRRNALIALQQYGLGRVMMLTFDRTWRLRYRAGDVYHHKFWGQVLRWATAGKLQAGTERARLGTDQTLYDPGEPVRVRAKIAAPDRSPLVGEPIAVQVYRGRQLVLRKKLHDIAGSPGMYEADLGVLPPDARYRIELDWSEAKRFEPEEPTGKVETEITVAPSPSAEWIELAADRTVPARLARRTGGAVAGPAEAAALLERFGPGTQTLKEEHRFLLWNSWPLLVTMVGLLTAEWVLRKKAGLV